MTFWTDRVGVRAALLSICGLACADLPGDVIGTYRITVKLEENECGKYAVYRLTDYSAQLRGDARHGYWRVPGQTSLLGKYEAPEFHFEYRSVVAQSTEDAGPSRCRLIQSEVLTGRVKRKDATDNEDPADEEAHDLEGEHELTISAEQSSDCESALAPVGAFEKLPCTVRYSLLGKRIKAF